MGGKKMFFGGNKKVYVPNTFIGGVGADYIISKEDMEALIVVGIVLGFNNINNNVSFYNKEDTLGFGSTNPFHNVNSLTHFISLVSVNLGGFNSFVNNINLKWFYVKGNLLTSSVNGYTQMSNLKNLQKIHLKENTLPLYNRTFLNSAESLIILDIRNTVDIAIARGNANFMYNAKNCRRINMEKVTIMNFNHTRYLSMFYKLKNGCKIYYNIEFGVKDRYAYLPISINNVVNYGQTFEINGLTYESTATPVLPGEFDGSSGNVNNTRTAIYNAINNDTRTGTFGKVSIIRIEPWSGNHALISSLKGIEGNSIITNFTNTPNISYTEGSNFRGGHDVVPNLEYARDVEGAILIEKTNYTIPNKPTSLSYSNLTSNSVELNFTEPTPNVNGTDCFEVWLDDGTVYRKMFEYAEIPSSGATLDLTEVVSDINSNGIGGLKIKIRTMDGQMNYSEFSNEITLP